MFNDKLTFDYGKNTCKCRGKDVHLRNNDNHMTNGEERTCVQRKYYISRAIRDELLLELKKLAINCRLSKSVILQILAYANAKDISISKAAEELADKGAFPKIYRAVRKREPLPYKLVAKQFY